MEDLNQILEHFLKNEVSRNFYNITTGNPVDIQSIAWKINELSDFQSNITIVNPGLNREYSGDNQLLIDEIGSFKFMKMEESLKRLINYYKSIFNTLDLETVKKDPYASRCKINK
jgi:nucleoside-diphosphate-sugar epimerase